MLIKLTAAASGKALLVNVRDIHRVSEPQTPDNAQDQQRFAMSKSVIEYNRPHPTRPGQFAFDFVRETPDEIAAKMVV